MVNRLSKVLKLGVALLPLFSGMPLQAKPLASAEQKEATSPNRGVTARPLGDVLAELNALYDANLLFEPSTVQGITVPADLLIDRRRSLAQNLDNLLSPLGLKYKKINRTSYTIKVAPGVKPRRAGLIKNEPASGIGQDNASNSASISRNLPMLNRRNAVADATVTGKVRDENGQALPGVNVLLKGTNVGTSTDVNGAFTLLAPEKGVLVFSYIGFATQEVAINGRTNIDVRLEAETRALDEAIVIGYGTVKKSDLTGAVSSVGSDEINAFPTANVMQGLAGRAAGVQVKQNTGAPGAPISVRIRGTNSIVGSNEPLYVIDGFPVSSAEVINNSSIKSIEILKDASAIAIYGSRASNGVVLITTNRGPASGQSRVTFETSYGTQSLIKDTEMMNPYEYGTFYNRLSANMGRTPRFTDDQITEFEKMGRGTNWQDVVFTKAPIQNHSLNIASGNEKTRFSITGSFFDQKGIIRNSNYSRYALNNNIQHTIGKALSIDLNLALSRNNTQRQLSDQGRFGTSLIGRAFGIPPFLPVYQEDGTYTEPTRLLTYVSEALFSPLNFIYEQSNKTIQNNVLLNTALSYKILDGLTLRVSGGIESRNSRNDFYQTKKFQNDPNGRATVTNTDFISLLNENTLSYDKRFGGRHQLSAVAGFTYQDFVTTSLTAGGSAFLSDIPESYSLATAGVFTTPGSSYTKSTLLSGLGRVNYTLDGRYLFTFSMRADGASVYSPGNKWGYFPSAALSWRISDEAFFQGVDFVNNLKLRTSWGKAGSQGISPYSTLNQLAPGSTVFGSSLFTTMAPANRLASDLKWETTEQVNFGLEVGVLEGRVQLTADYYVKQTRDLLNAVQLPRSTGYTNSLRNVGRVGNKGLELDLTADIFGKGDFKWDLNANIAFNRTKVLELYGGQDILAGNVNMIIFNDFANTYREGQPLGVIYGFEEDGYDEKGFLKYKSDTKVKIGDPNPNFIFGINSTMAYKNLSLSLFFSGTQGNDIVNMSAVAFTVDYTNGTSKLKEVLDNHWTPENTDAKYPIPSTSNRYRF
uniref:SusC/RagA family TonB-linked outer membrane protein n=1 Tax=Persicitalea sp. TaxID=3100273 RepID=UPI003594371A